MKHFTLIGFLLSILTLAGMTCRLTLWSRPEPDRPAGSATPASSPTTQTPTVQPSPTVPAFPAGGSGGMLYLPLQARLAPEIQAGSEAVPGDPPSPGMPGLQPGQPGGLIPPVGLQLAGVPVQIIPPDLPLARPPVYILQRGEFPYCLARRYDIHPQDLMALNGFSYQQVFSPGQAVRLPQTGRPFPGRRARRSYPASYVVQPGDSIYSIACDFGDLDPQVLRQANPTGASGRLKAGTPLVILAPGQNTAASQVFDSGSAAPPVIAADALTAAGPTSSQPPARKPAAAVALNRTVRLQTAAWLPPVTPVMGPAVVPPLLWPGLPVTAMAQSGAVVIPGPARTPDQIDPPIPAVSPSIMAVGALLQRYNTVPGVTPTPAAPEPVPLPLPAATLAPPTSTPAPNPIHTPRPTPTSIH